MEHIVRVQPLASSVILCLTRFNAASCAFVWTWENHSGILQDRVSSLAGESPQAFTPALMLQLADIHSQECTLSKAA